MPRLELQAALLGARLAQTVVEEHDYEVESKTYWSDSRTALVWIRSEPRVYKSFVAHRLAEIEETTKKNEWRWLPSKENVADDATQRTPENFNSTHRWYQGPSFLKLPESQWPKEETVTRYDTGEEREKCNICQQEDSINQNYLPKIERFSKWLRLIRATARVLHFIDLCKPSRNTVAATRERTKKNVEKDSNWWTKKKTAAAAQTRKDTPHNARHYLELPTSHIFKAVHLWVRASRKKSFRAEIQRIKKGEKPSSNDRLSHLSVYLDAEGTVRLKGRVPAAREMEEIHVQFSHIGRKRKVHQVVHSSRSRETSSWRGENSRKRAETTAVDLQDTSSSKMYCEKLSTVPNQKSEACKSTYRRLATSTPRTSRTSLPAFTGLDFFGPIEVTVARHHEKRYGALFTCMTSRAIHNGVGRWVKEYVLLLQYRREPTNTGTQRKVGDFVIICDSNLPRNTWPRGRISQLYPGADGKIRVVDVTTSNGHVLRRPTQKIVVLPTESQRGDGGRMCTTP